jgi:AraC-like DNA-binding protein
VRSCGHDIALDEPGRVSVILPLRGSFAVVGRGGARISAGAGGAVWLPPGRRASEIRPGGDGDYAALIALGPAPRRGAQAGAIADAAAVAAAAALRASCGRLMAEAQDAAGPLGRPRGRGLAAAMLVDQLAALAEAFGAGSGPRAASEARVRRALEFMRATCDEPLTMAEVAEAAGVGLRALELAFKRLRGDTPRGALAMLRLERARERLLAAAPRASVTDAALDSGFAHLGRFAGAYRARFGEAPSETLARSRAAPSRSERQDSFSG